MPYITGTLLPAQITVLCPRCKANRLMTAISTSTYWCAGCEWQMTVGAGASPVATNALTVAGATALPFASGGGVFSAGQYLWYAGATPEVVLVTGTTSGTSVPCSPTQFNHATAQGVSLATATATLSVLEIVPPAPGWGF
jgi:hypothetical protein